MKENNDPHQIVISREYFDELVRMAKRQPYSSDVTGGKGVLASMRHDRLTLPRILWHVRKFNTRYKEEQTKQREDKQTEWKRLRNQTIDLLKNYEGKVVYVDGFHPANKHLPMLLIGRGHKSKLHVMVKRIIDNQPDGDAEDVHIRNIVTELPE